MKMDQDGSGALDAKELKQADIITLHTQNSFVVPCLTRLILCLRHLRL